MNQMVPVGQYNRVAYFYATDGSNNIGRFSKDAGKAVMCRLDYSKLTTAPGAGPESFSVDIGSNPPLAISSSQYNQNGPYVDFILSGGVEGQTYTLLVSIAGTTVREDVFTIDVPLTTCDCGVGNNSNVAKYPAGYGMVYINSTLKYTVGDAQPPAPNIKDQWYNPASGALYEYITDGVSTWWQQITPALPVVSFQTIKLQAIVPDGLTTQFNLLTFDGKSPNILVSTDLLVSVDDVLQNPDVDYRAFTNQIIFIIPPAVDSIVFMTWFAHY